MGLADALDRFGRWCLRTSAWLLALTVLPALVAVVISPGVGGIVFVVVGLLGLARLGRPRSRAPEPRAPGLLSSDYATCSLCRRSVRLMQGERYDPATFVCPAH